MAQRVGVKGAVSTTEPPFFAPKREKKSSFRPMFMRVSCAA